MQCNNLHLRIAKIKSQTTYTAQRKQEIIQISYFKRFYMWLNVQTCRRMTSS